MKNHLLEVESEFPEPEWGRITWEPSRNLFKIYDGERWIDLDPETPMITQKVADYVLFTQSRKDNGLFAPEQYSIRLKFTESGAENAVGYENKRTGQSRVVPVPKNWFTVNG